MHAHRRAFLEADGSRANRLAAADLKPVLACFTYAELADGLISLRGWTRLNPH